MPKPRTAHDYIYCLTCYAPLENEVMRKVETPTIYFDFALCENCREQMLAQGDPLVSFFIGGDELKSLLKSKRESVALYGWEADAKVP